MLPLLIALVLAPPWSEPANVTSGFPVRFVPPTKGFPPDAAASRPVTYGATRAVAVANDGGRVWVTFGRTDGTFGTPRRIATRPAGVYGTVIAANASGDIAIAWLERRGPHNNGIYIAFRPKGKPFTPPIRQATDRADGVSIAVSPRGDLLLAWTTRGVVKARIKPARAPFFRRAETIESEPAFFAGLNTAITGNGRAYVAWAAQLMTEGGESGEGFYQVAVKPAGARRFRPAQLLERRPANEYVSELDLVVDDSNRATVAWGATTVRAATTDARAVFGAPQEIAPGTEVGLAGTPDGRRLVAWTAGAEGGPLFAALAPAGGPFGAPESVTASGPDTGNPIAAAFGEDRWWLVWRVPTAFRTSSRPG